MIAGDDDHKLEDNPGADKSGAGCAWDGGVSEFDRGTTRERDNGHHDLALENGRLANHESMRR